jgi:tRNA pseudouridine(38-40) synthase
VPSSLGHFAAKIQKIQNCGSGQRSSAPILPVLHLFTCSLPTPRVCLAHWYWCRPKQALELPPCASRASEQLRAWTSHQPMSIHQAKQFCRYKVGLQYVGTLYSGCAYKQRVAPALCVRHPGGRFGQVLPWGLEQPQVQLQVTTGYAHWSLALLPCSCAPLLFCSCALYCSTALLLGSGPPATTHTTHNTLCSTHCTPHTAHRTDAGVHALRNVLQVDIRRRGGTSHQAENVPPSTVQNALNFHLDSNTSLLHVRDVALAKQTFDARRSTLGRTYTYRLLVPRKRGLVIQRASQLSLFQHERAWRMDRPLNIPAMRAAAQELLGQQDFSSFRNARCQSSSPVRRVLAVDIASTADYPPDPPYPPPPYSDYSSSSINSNSGSINSSGSNGSGNRGSCSSSGSSRSSSSSSTSSSSSSTSQDDSMYSTYSRSKSDQEVPSFVADVCARGQRDVTFFLVSW